MAPPLAELTARAQSLTSAGDLEAARDVLDVALDQSDTDPRRASPDLATAAALHARVLIALGDPHAAKMWAGFAHAAEDRLHGARDERAIAAAATHAAVLARIGHHGRAAQVYRDLLAALQAVDQDDSPRVLAAEADLATAEHHSGQCTVARDRLQDAWTRHRDAYGDSPPAGIKMLARLAVMERECGLRVEAQEHLAMAQELCARNLPAGHPLVQQVDRLAGAPPSGKHVCGRVAPSDGPDATAEQTTYRPDSPPEPPPMPEPDNRSTDPKGSLYQQPLYLSEVHQAPGDLTGRHARADTPLPMPGPRIPEYTEAGRRVPVGSAPVGDLDRRLPVRTDKAEPGSSRQPFILAAVLVAGVGVAAAVVAATLPRGDPPPPAAAPTTVTSAPAAAPSVTPSPSGEGGSDGAPTELKLRDNRDAVVISWVYPKGADGPLLISGGRAGQERKVFQQMPAGSSDYIAYGLNDRLDYCFSVAVVYSSDKVASTAPICTDR
ncbi:fibronectin type III domain-containing protein [Actinoplanes sp. NBRC 103695]|uniref:fibronectin type III domain-containing protein n=1 Tax=Actinoplanes sp. NBRC 103695 TaxID=3032202 RepID=UPI0024A04632|nr:fibronectin type III domain-containing protein [Actinoplanes sp. NBRC 103695]GLY94437.1 hypothetical protein Acsp02_16930 [Actinoplanes sp. NBRC 103695]